MGAHQVLSAAARALAQLKEQNKSFATAESLTGGLISARFTELSGASCVYRGGVVSYTNGVKERLLGVPHALLEECGAVSEPVARAMAEGARRATGADFALSATGVAGPERDERGTPVGRVFLGLASEKGTLCRPLSLCGSRAEIRERVVEEAFALLLENL